MFLSEKNINEVLGLSVISPLGNTGRNQNSADNHRLAYKESLEGKTNKELKNKVSLTILDKECLQRESPSL